MEASRASYIALFLGLMTLTMIGSWLSNRLSGSLHEFVTSPREQNAELYIDSLGLEPVDGIGKEISLVPQTGSVWLEVASNGHLFVIREGQSDLVQEYSESGEFLSSWKGPGDTEILSVSDISIEPGRLWIADLLGGSVHLMDRITGEWRAVGLDSPPYRVEVIPSSAKLLVTRVAAPQLFHEVAFNGASLRSFGVILKEQEANALLLDGFVSLSGDTVVFAGKYLGLVAAFSVAGDLRYIVESIRPPSKAALMKKGQARWVRHGILLASNGLASDDSAFYSLTRRLNGGRICCFIDAYRLKTGEYYKSLRLPCKQRWLTMAVGTDFLYAATDQSIYRWPASALEPGRSSIVALTGQYLLPISRSHETKGEK